MIKTRGDTDFDEKLDFGERGKLDKPVLDEPITVHIRAKDRTQAAVVGDTDDEPGANLTPATVSL